MGAAGRGLAGGVEQVGDGHGLVAVRARAADADPPAEGVALLAALLIEVAGIARRALVDAHGPGGALGAGAAAPRRRR